MRTPAGARKTSPEKAPARTGAKRKALQMPSTETLPHPMITDGDSPRARRSDRDTSHIAADATQATIKVTKLRVLQLVLQEGPILGSELNDLYELRAARNDWHPIHRDSPRKRAGELAEDGFLDASETQQSPGNHLPEAEYRITDKGRAALGVVS